MSKLPEFHHELDKYDDFSCKHCTMSAGFWPSIPQCPVRLQSALTAAQERERRLELQLRRNHRGYLNILEFRRIKGSDRYGALTREELDQVISEIESALSATPEQAPAMCDQHPSTVAIHSGLCFFQADNCNCCQACVDLCKEQAREAYGPDEMQAPAREGITLIAQERQRQIEKEGWTPEHDDEHRGGELSRAAVCYIKGNATGWPWEPSWWKPKDRITNLAKAGALIAAEIDRLKRYHAAISASKDGQQ